MSHILTKYSGKGPKTLNSKVIISNFFKIDKRIFYNSKNFLADLLQNIFPDYSSKIYRKQ